MLFLLITGIFTKCCICEFYEYKSVNVIPGIQYTGTIDKYTENTSVAECILFCLDLPKTCVSVSVCGDTCSCYSASGQMSDSLYDNSCTFFQIKRYEMSNCFDIYERGSMENGIYNITVNGRQLEAYCDMDHGGWTAIQYRFDGSVDFNRSYAEYQDGFGDVYGEHWLGLDTVHDMVACGSYEARFDLEDFDGKTGYAEYDYFYISNSTLYYKLEISGYHGNVGHGMEFHTGMYFSAGTVDNDISSSNCVKKYGHGGWWYTGCHQVNINGLYNNTEFGKGMNWNPWRGYQYSLKSTSMKIRPRQ